MSGIELDEQQELRFLRDTKSFLNIFPELVWHRIIEHLDDNKDKQNLINSSLFFRNLLYNELIYVFFQDVIKLLAYQRITDTEAKSSVLNCRRVCHAWNNAIEDLAQNEKKWEIDHSTKSVSPIFQLIRSSYNFTSTEKLENFLQKFVKLDNNPLLGRTIKFSSHVYFYWAPFYSRNVLPFFEQYGHHIWSCTFHLKELGQMESEVIFRNVVKTLFLMPNLKKMRIEYEDRLKFVPMAALSAPMLPNLETLELSFVCTPFCDAVIVENTHITNLVLAMSNAHLLHPFENLKELELYQCNMVEIEGLKNYNGLKWPLNKLTLRFDDKVDWAELLDFLSTRCGGTLEELVLSTYHQETKEPEENKIRTDCHIGRLNCPKLRKLKLCTANYSSFNFLLGTANSLEHLHVEWKLKKTKRLKKRLEQMCTEADLEDVQILEYRQSLYTSNIWRLFPKLKTVSLNGYDMSSKQMYARNEWVYIPNMN